ncbi:hypothetical protein [Aliidiomarina sanyensis]|uniref:Uncharacterized protein n=1 Tax=Aliidiomarina sanyensis TaxID=1249555 RepID=A0A432WBW9_9GAMM|nr:hypothetical protein [Aliidiomarina sanyensis]RUO29485.1 hypothetical protein CWE11_09565 [Aliidiomarina sanyensis]
MKILKKLNKKVALVTIWGTVLVSWLILGVIFFATESTTVAVIVVTIAAVIAESALWLSGLLLAMGLGMALVDARKNIWKLIFRARG